MPDTRELQSNAVSSSANPSPYNLDEAVRRLKIQGNGGGDAQHNRFPDRPGEPDCIYYLRTGSCGYGSNCRYNHPTAEQGGQHRDEPPERVGQPDCQYFLKTGACKFGATCKYHHPRDKHDVRLVSLNILGLPIRQDEKSCPYYMRTGTCKFGFVCKFNHPQPATLEAGSPITCPSTYGSVGSSMASPSAVPLIGGFSPWPLSRIPYISNTRMPGLPAYMPVAFSPSQGTMPLQQGWSTYTGALSHVPSTEVLGTNQISNFKHLSQSGSSIPVDFPERPDQPECQYYMRTGSCKYGATCKYHHPKERNSQAMCMLGPLGFPLRPGQAVCSFYSMYGSCKYGSACKFDHPLVGYYNYNMPALSISDPSAIPSQRNSEAIRTLAETSPSKTRPQDWHMKSAMSNGVQDADNKVDVDFAETTSPSHTAPSSESPEERPEVRPE